jgi:hypothetical protein
MQGAIYDFTQAINMNSKYVIAYYNRGNAYYTLGKYQDAIDDFNKAASIYKQENNFHDYHKTLEQLKNIQSDDVELKSVVGINYTRLRDLLAAGKWKEADMETKQVMLAVAKREKEGRLDERSIDNFPCEDLRTIDQLWVKYSGGKFGFSVQKRIYQGLERELMGKYGRSSGTMLGWGVGLWEKFGDKVGWRKGGDWLYYKDITFDKKAPEGHLPTAPPLAAGVLVSGTGGWVVVGEWSVSSLASRLVSCNI